MNQHIETLIDAYLDGELSEKQVRNVESHIKNCPECLVQIEQRRYLSSMLNAVPGYSSKKSSEQFVSEVNLLLPRQQKKPKSTLSNLIWISIPLALLASFAFVQALTLVSSVFELFPGADELFVRTFTGSTFSFHLIPWLQSLIEGATIWFGVDWIFQWNLITYIFSMIIIGILYLLWLAGWFVRNDQFKAQES